MVGTRVGRILGLLLLSVAAISPSHRQSVGNVLSVDQPISFPKLEGTALASYPPRLFDGLSVGVAFDVLDRQNVVGGIEYVTPVVRHGRSPLPHLAGSPSRS